MWSSGDEILASFDDDCRLLEEAATSSDRIRVKSAVVVCRRFLLEGMMHRVQKQLDLQHRLEFRVVDLLGVDFAAVLGLTAKPTTEVSLVPDGLFPDSAPPGAQTHTLTLDQFLAHRVAVHNASEISVADVIRFLANKDGGVHYDARLDADAQKLRELNRSLRVMNIDSLLSCVRGIARVLLATVLPLRIEILRRYVSQAGALPVPYTHLEIAKALARELYRRKDWTNTKLLLGALLETAARSVPANPTFEDHMSILYQWGNVHLDQPDGFDELLWTRAFALSLVERLKPEPALACRAVSLLCGPMLRIATRTAGRERVAAELNDQLKAAYARDPHWHYWAKAVGDDVVASWSSAPIPGA